MSNTIQSLATVNSFIRTLIALAVMGVVAAGSWFGYRTYYAKDIEAAEKEQALADAQQKIESAQLELTAIRTDLATAKKDIQHKEETITKLNVDLQAKIVEIQRLDAALRYLKMDRRKAVITVLDVWEDEDTKEKFSKVEFAELDENGKPYGKPKVFKLRGDEFYIDAWLVKFQDEYTQKADLLRGTTLVLFKSIYGNVDGPTGSYPIEDVGARPEAYGQGRRLLEFEREIWNDIWSIANDPDKAQEMGIRAAHGQANYTKARKGKTYHLQLRASDGISILPAKDAKPRTNKPPA